MAELKFVAIDFGAESGRGVVGTLSEGKLRLEEAHRFPNGPTHVLNSLHWDVLQLYSQMKVALTECVKKHGTQIEGIGVDTWGVDFGLLGRGDVLLGNPYHYRDDRTDGMMEKAFERMPREQIFEHTGIQFIKLNTVYQLLSMVLGKSPLLDAAETLLLMPDLFNFLLTGRKVSEFTIATTTQCYDPRKGTWSKAVFDALDLPFEIMPEIIPPGTVVGPLLPAIAEEVGARDVAVVAPACHDTAAAVAAVPAKGENYAYISSGTWSLMGIEITEPIINQHSLTNNFTNEGGVCGTFRFLKNIMGLWLVQECRRAWEKEGKAFSYQDLADRAAQAAPFGPIVEPDHESFMSIGDMPAKIATFCEKSGQRAPQSEGEFVRCALESLALKYRWTLEKIEECCGRRVETVHIVGGGSQNRLLNQLAADAMKRPVVTGPVEATAAGNVLMQALCRGRVGSIDEVREVVRNSFTLETFEPAAGDRWDEVYDRYLRIMEKAEKV